MMVICNYLLDDRDRRSEGEIKEMYFDLMDMIEEQPQGYYGYSLIG